MIMNLMAKKLAGLKIVIPACKRAELKLKAEMKQRIKQNDWKKQRKKGLNIVNKWSIHV